MLVNISHDLKTPLTVVYGYAEMLLAPELNLAPAVRTKVEKIYAKTRDVLDMLLLFFEDVYKRQAEAHGHSAGP